VLKNKSYNNLYLPSIRKAAKGVIAKQIKKELQDEKGVHPENYRLVAFKDMSNEDVLSLNLLQD
jgi:hypothetical protein